ncbi:MAG: hypothetical protein ACRDVD_00705 [Acidimicrobiia bacterium]
MKTRLLFVASAVALAMSVAACGEEGSDDTSPPPTTATSTSQSPTTAGSPPSPTTAPTDTNSGADGSGCTPGEGDDLPDGEWFGFVDHVEDDDLSFDLACWFSGAAAAAAAAEDGEESPPPNDYYIRNVNDRLWELDVRDGAPVRWLPNAGDATSEELVDFETWAASRGDRGDAQPGVWITVFDEEIEEIREQYVP